MTPPKAGEVSKKVKDMELPDAMFPTTEFDRKYRWECCECDYFSYNMYEADTHQCETEHCMTRLKI